MKLIDPSTKVLPLKKEDIFISSCISAPIENEEKFQKGIDIIKSWGLIWRKEFTLSEAHKWGYLAGKDKERINSLKKPQNVPLQTFSRGGWGAARLLEKKPSWTNGWVLGFSDICSILLSRLSAGFDGCVHGPVISSLADEPKWSQERLKSILFGAQLDDLNGDPWSKGTAQGPLIVTNLTIGTSLIGTKHMPNLNGAILILEDTSEEPYRIERMLTHWRLSGLFERVAGIGFGNFLNCENEEYSKNNSTFTVEEVLRERTKDLGIPILGNLPIGHSHGNASLPLGKKAEIDAFNGKLAIIST